MATPATDPLDGHDPLARAYRIVRRLGSPDSPFPGSLARDGSDAVVLVEPDALPGASREPDRGAHVLQATDAARTAEGTLLVVPWCVDSADTVIRRAGTLTAGEAITFAVSVHRGVRALTPARGEPEARGSWWVTDAGCPVFVRAGGDEAPTVSEASENLWEAIREACASAPVRASLSRLACTSDDVESVLFAHGSPEPVPLAAATRRRVDSLPRVHTVEPVDDTPARGLREFVRGSISRHVDGDLAASVSDALHGVRRRLRTARPPRARRSLVFAGAAAAAVIAVGLLWPNAAPDATAGDRAPVSTPAPTAEPGSPVPSATPSAAATPALVAAQGAGGDPTSVMDDLLRRAAGCELSSTCGDVYEPGADTTALAAVSALPGAERSIALLDDLGGVAVLRITPKGGDESVIVVIVHGGTSWLVRDVRSAPRP